MRIGFSIILKENCSKRNPQVSYILFTLENDLYKPCLVPIKSNFDDDEVRDTELEEENSPIHLPNLGTVSGNLHDVNRLARTDISHLRSEKSTPINQINRKLD